MNLCQRSRLGHDYHLEFLTNGGIQPINVRCVILGLFLLFARFSLGSTDPCLSETRVGAYKENSAPSSRLLSVPAVDSSRDSGLFAYDSASGSLLAPKGATDLSKAGRAGKQARLRELVDDPTVSSADRGWIQQEMNSIERGQRTRIRVPPGKNLAHRRGFEAKKGHGYEHSDLQDIDLHKLQHMHEGY